MRFAIGGVGGGEVWESTAVEVYCELDFGFVCVAGEGCGADALFWGGHFGGLGSDL